MGTGQGVENGVGHDGITCVLQTQISSFIYNHHRILVPIDLRVVGWCKGAG